MIKTIIQRLRFNRKQQIKEFQAALDAIFDHPLLSLGGPAVAEFLGSIFTNAVLFVKDDSGTFLPRAFFGFKPDHFKEIRLTPNSIIVSFLEKGNKEIHRATIIKQVDNESLWRELDVLNAHVCFPIKAHGELLGLLAFGVNRWTERRIKEYENEISTLVINMGLALSNLKLRNLRDKVILGSEEAKEITAKLKERYKDDPDYHIFCQKIAKYREQFFANEEENKDWQSLEIEKRQLQVAMNFFDSLREGKSKEEAIADLVKQSGTKLDPICVDAALQMFRKGII